MDFRQRQTGLGERRADEVIFICSQFVFEMVVRTIAEPHPSVDAQARHDAHRCTSMVTTGPSSAIRWY